MKINTYLGYEVTVDDGLPCDTSTGTYTTYFMGKGAFARNDGMPQHLVGVETDRQKLKALNILINRRALASEWTVLECKCCINWRKEVRSKCRS